MTFHWTPIYRKTLFCHIFGGKFNIFLFAKTTTSCTVILPPTVSVLLCKTLKNDASFQTLRPFGSSCGGRPRRDDWRPSRRRASPFGPSQCPAKKSKSQCVPLINTFSMRLHNLHRLFSSNIISRTLLTSKRPMSGFELQTFGLSEVTTFSPNFQSGSDIVANIQEKLETMSSLESFWQLK